MFNILSGYAVDFAAPIVQWATIGAVVALLLVGIIILFTEKQFFATFVKNAIFALFIFSLIAGITMLALDVAKHYDAAYLSENYVDKSIIPFVLSPIIFTLSVALMGAITLFILSKRNSSAFKPALFYVIAVVGVGVVSCFVLILIYYTSHISGDGYYTAESSGFNQPALYISSALLVAGIIVAAILTDKDKTPFDAKTIARAGICIGLSFALSYVQLFKLPQGGTITLASMLPIMLFAYVYGAKKGVAVGLIYGILQSVQDPFIIHPAQFLLDYPIAFTMLGFAGVFSRFKPLEKLPQVKFALGAAVATVLRFAAHVLSGVFAFGAYAVDSGASNLLLYSVAYNSFVFVDMAIVIAVGALLLSNKSFIKVITK